MSLNFSRVFTAFTEPEYNKSNLLQYILLLIALVIVAAISSNFFFAMAVFTIIYIIQQGYMVIISNNEAFGKNEIIPDINSIGKIITEGFKYLTGISTLAIIINLPIIIIITVAIIQGINIAASGSVNSNNIISLVFQYILLLSVFSVLSVILTLKIIIPAKLLFMRTLDLSDMFSLSKINQYGKIISKDFWSYVLYFIILTFLINTVTQVISQLFTGLFFSSNIMSQLSPEAMKDIQNFEQAVQFLTNFLNKNGALIIGGNGIITIIPMILNILFMPELNAQIIKNSFPKRKKTKVYDSNEV